MSRPALGLALTLAAVNVVIVWYGGYLNTAGNASIGDIMAFQWYTFLLLNPVWNIVNSFSELQRSLAATERVFEVLAMPDDKPDRPGARDAGTVVNEIRFDGNPQTLGLFLSAIAVGGLSAGLLSDAPAAAGPDAGPVRVATSAGRPSG